MSEEAKNNQDYGKWFRMGLYTLVKPDPFDSESERRICLILNHILRDYALDALLNIRLMPQQALDNYIAVRDSDPEDPFRRYFQNKHKWMKFDFLFVKVYEYRSRMHHIPVAVVEFDGPDHKKKKQRQLDAYKDGVAESIGAGMVRIGYDALPGLEETAVRERYEDEILRAIIRGYFTESRNYRKGGRLIGPEQEKQYQHIVSAYQKRMEDSPETAAFSGRMIALLAEARSTGVKPGN